MRPIRFFAPFFLLTTWVATYAQLDSAAMGKLQRVNAISGTAPAIEAPVRSMGGLLLQTGLALAVVVILIVALVALLKRMNQRSGIAGLAGNGIELLEVQQIAPGHRIGILRVYEQQMVISLSAEGVRYLAPLTTASEAARHEAPKAPAQFSSAVDQLLARFRRPEAASLPPGQPGVGA